MSLSNMEVFNKYYMSAIFETLDQLIDKFNAASAGTIILSAEGFEGDFSLTSFYNRLSGARRRVDRYGANTAVAPVDLTQDQKTIVKVAGGYGPARFEPSQMTWLQKPTAEAIAVMSAMFAEDLLEDQLNSVIAALAAAIEGQGAATVVDVSTGATPKAIDYLAINESHALFGDHSTRIAAEVMTGRQYHNFIAQNLVNKESLFQAGNVRVVDILGRPGIVTDSPSLFVPAAGGNPAVQKVLSLVAEAGTVHDDRDLIMNIETSNGKQRLETTLQADYTFGIGLQGYSWDKVNGGKSPTDAGIATSANWDLIVDSIKHSAGTMAIGLAE